MLNLFKRVRYFLFLRLRNQAEKIPWKLLDLKLTTATGLNLSIKNRSEWHLYNEIFVRGDYDFAINLALSKKVNADKFQFLDLGANVGFFSLRCIDLILQYSDNPLLFDGITVEGSLKVFNELTDRLNQSAIKGQVKVVHGLAGKKEGEAKMYESGNAMTNSIKSTSSLRKRFSGKNVSYINISKFYDESSTIDLLKCDIEGSEEEFLENYKGLLPKVKVSVFELHHKKANTDRCIEILKQNGLIKRRTIFNYGEDTSLEVFWRD